MRIAKVDTTLTGQNTNMYTYPLHFKRHYLRSPEFDSIPQ